MYSSHYSFVILSFTLKSSLKLFIYALCFISFPKSLFTCVNLPLPQPLMLFLFPFLPFFIMSCSFLSFSFYTFLSHLSRPVLSWPAFLLWHLFCLLLFCLFNFLLVAFFLLTRFSLSAPSPLTSICPSDSLSCPWPCHHAETQTHTPVVPWHWKLHFLFNFLSSYMWIYCSPVFEVN